MTVTLSVQQYPFVKDSQTVLSKLNITYENIDTTNTYDEILQEAFNDIIDAVTRKKLEWFNVISQIEKSSFEREVAKFYLSLMIIKASTILTRQFIRYYIRKFEITVNHYTSKITSGDLNILPYYLILFKEFGIEWKLIKQGEHHFIKTYVTNYMDFETLIENNDPPEYQILRLVNCGVSKGYVYFYHKDYFDFQHMLNKLLQERIRKLVNNIEEKIKCQKIEKCRDYLNKYMKDKEGLSYQPNDVKVLEYGEVSNKDLLHNETVLKLFKDKQTLENVLPPCIWVILDQIHDRKDELIHNQNILLASYLATKGYTEEQIVEVFKQTCNYDEKISKYNIKYILRKKLKPMNCRSLLPENLCNKQHDKTSQCSQIKNPLSYREMINKRDE